MELFYAAISIVVIIATFQPIFLIVVIILLTINAVLSEEKFWD